MYRLAAASLSTLALHPHLLFQRAMQTPDDTLPGRIARRRLESGQEQRPWLRAINRLPTRTAEIFRLPLGRAKMSCIAVAADGSRILTGQDDRVLVIWETATSERLLTMETEVKCDLAALSDDGRRFAVARTDGRIEIRDTVEGQLLATLEAAHESLFSELRFSPDARRVALTNELYGGRIWEWETGRTLVDRYDRESQADERFCMCRHLRYWARLHRGFAEMWDAESGEKLWERTFSRDHSETALFTPDSIQILLVTWGGAAFHDVRTGEAVRTLDPGKAIRYDRVVVLSQNGAVAAGALCGETAAWDTTTGAMLWRSSEHQAKQLALSPDGRLMAGFKAGTLSSAIRRPASYSFD